MADQDAPDLLQISDTLQSLLKNAEARCVLLVDSTGAPITWTGRLAPEEVQELCTSAARSLGLLREKGGIFLEGKPVHCSLVGQSTILVVACHEAAPADKVRVCAHQARSNLVRIFTEMARRADAEDRQLPEEFSREATRRIEKLPDQ